MSEPAAHLPERPSLEQLRKQAKELLRLLQNRDESALARLRACKSDITAPILADAQYALAREHGFESWAKLVHHLRALAADLEEHQQIAADMLAAYNSADTAAATRLNDLFHSSLDLQQIRDFIRDRLYSLPDTGRRISNFTLADAQLLVARLYGFTDWSELVQSSNTSDRDMRSAPVVLSSRPPFYRIDWTTNSIQPRQPMSVRDWEKLCGVVNELGITAINAANLVGDEDLRVISQLEQITSLNLDGARRVTDKGLHYLRRMPQLRRLTLGGLITDRGLQVLEDLRELRVFEMFWQAGISDAGISHLRFADHLEAVDLLGTATGDGAIAALRGKPKLRQFKTGRNVTDAGLEMLHQFPAFTRWAGGEVKYGLFSFSGEPTNLLIDGPFTGKGLAALRGLDGIFGLSFFRHTTRVRGDDLQNLAGLSHLGYVGCPGELCDDDAMRHIAALPGLRMLMGQGTVASDDGFRSLSRSQSIEYFWGRECPNLRGNGFAALAGMPALKGLAVSCRFVDDESLARLADFPALKELMPMDVSDAGFKHVGSCRQLESLILMYCRDTGDAATGHLNGLSNLKKYHAGYTVITDRSLEMLGQMRSLEGLSFEGCKFITDAGVPFLARLPRLREISIGGCPRITRSGARTFPHHVLVNYDTR